MEQPRSCGQYGYIIGPYCGRRPCYLGCLAYGCKMEGTERRDERSDVQSSVLAFDQILDRYIKGNNGGVTTVILRMNYQMKIIEFKNSIHL